MSTDVSSAFEVFRQVVSTTKSWLAQQTESQDPHREVFVTMGLFNLSHGVREFERSLAEIVPQENFEPIQLILGTWVEALFHLSSNPRIEQVPEYISHIERGTKELQEILCPAPKS